MDVARVLWTRATGGYAGFGEYTAKAAACGSKSWMIRSPPGTSIGPTNTLGLARLIAEGQLDAWLLYPRQPLAHLLLGRMSATAWGDVLFGIVVYLVFVRPDPGRLVLFLLLSVTAAGVFVGFSILSASLSFYLGNGSPLSDQWRTAMMTFSTYPSTLFRGGAKLVLFTFIPAGFVSTLPVEALRTLSVWNTLLAIGGSVGVLGAGVLVFQHGLRRYESGNLMLMRE